MDIRLIALDMDGTVLKTDKTMSPKTAQTLRAAADSGIMLVPATGRMRGMIPREMLDVGTISYAITSNGASIIDLEKDREIYANQMTLEDSRRIIDFLMPYDVMVEAYAEGRSYVDNRHYSLLSTFKGYPKLLMDLILQYQTFVDDLPGFLKKNRLCLEKINIPYMGTEVREELAEKLEAMKEYSITASFGNNLEINAASASKGDALSHLCQKLGIAPEQVMAFGDERNDLEMLKFAGCGVAMGNGHEDVRQVADYVTLTNEEDGVADAIEKLLHIS
ncbi:Cof-type HAD-IIB family hydrolase [Caproiciproducens faecalis]|uniref:HAD family phosphatase n=1 Tax=Caproiciproducens faecalis TaxID=2820301 RepID=A0ABS7DNG9_9FIRM|nr:Cof-type HAD-IIB family hydrolase [Caproiciproducens faecalis]MBW7572845.1 HAD family phosphatase [Caproiciproducens faecalis]